MRSLLLLALLVAASAHCSFWHPSTFDCDRANGNSNRNAQPLENLTFDKWWWHGNMDCPPAEGQVFRLPANGQAVVEISSNKAFTSKANGGHVGMNQPNTPVPWTGNSWSNIHAPNREDVAGCAFAIAYKSNPKEVKPTDFVIFSVVHDCIARQNQTFSIPNLPACPNGKCMCAWFWIHKSIGGSDQIYMTPFVCNVDNVRSDASAVDVARAQPPRKCYNPSRCTRGPRNPMYWKNIGAQNMPEDGHRAPTYSILYGFPEGAQNDIFVKTNPLNYTVSAHPAEKKCTNAKFNPQNFGSRISSDNSKTFLLDGGASIVSPNCQFKAFLEHKTGSFMLINNTDNKALWYGGAKERNKSPYTLKINSDGELVTYDNNRTAQWTAPMTKGSGRGSFRLDVTDDGQLVLTDALQQHRWENFFFDDRENKFLSTAADPKVWSVAKPTRPVTASATKTVSYTFTRSS